MRLPNGVFPSLAPPKLCTTLKPPALLFCENPALATLGNAGPVAREHPGKPTHKTKAEPTTNGKRRKITPFQRLESPTGRPIWPALSNPYPCCAFLLVLSNARKAVHLPAKQTNAPEKDATHHLFYGLARFPLGRDYGVGKLAIRAKFAECDAIVCIVGTGIGCPAIL